MFFHKSELNRPSKSFLVQLAEVLHLKISHWLENKLLVAEQRVSLQLGEDIWVLSSNDILEVNLGDSKGMDVLQSEVDKPSPPLIYNIVIADDLLALLLLSNFIKAFG